MEVEVGNEAENRAQQHYNDPHALAAGGLELSFGEVGEYDNQSGYSEGKSD